MREGQTKMAWCIAVLSRWKKFTFMYWLSITQYYCLLLEELIEGKYFLISMQCALCCPWGPVLPYVALCCPMLPYVALCCPMLPYVALCCPMLPYVALCCPMLPYVALCCPLLPNVAKCCQTSINKRRARVSQSCLSHISSVDTKREWRKTCEIQLLLTFFLQVRHGFDVPPLLFETNLSSWRKKVPVLFFQFYSSVAVLKFPPFYFWIKEKLVFLVVHRLISWTKNLSDCTIQIKGLKFIILTIISRTEGCVPQPHKINSLRMAIC